MTGLKRTDYCGNLRISDVGREVVVAGWVQRQRDLGALIFIDLRVKYTISAMYAATPTRAAPLLAAQAPK